MVRGHAQRGVRLTEWAFAGPVRAGLCEEAIGLLEVLACGRHYKKSSGAAALHTYHAPMSVAEISNLPSLEKLQIMEAIWLDLRGRIEPMGIPLEHRALLDERRARVESGAAVLHEWDEVKHTIGQR